MVLKIKSYKQAIRGKSVLLLHKIYVKSWLPSLAFLYNKMQKMFVIKMSFETNSLLVTFRISALYSPGRVDMDDVLRLSPEVVCSFLGEENL